MADITAREQVTPMVWIGGLCGEVTDALPGTRQSDESSCECSDECVSVACQASEYEEEPEDAPEVEEWELAIESDASTCEDAPVGFLSALGSLWPRGVA